MNEQERIHYIKKGSAQVSDNPLLTGTVHLVLSEGTHHIVIPGEAVQREPDAVLRKQIRDVLKENVEMTGEETGFRTGGLTKQLVDSQIRIGS